MSRKRLILLGTFDGVHRGHRRLLSRFLELARRWKLQPRIVLFALPPRFYFSPPASPSLLTTPSERAAILRSLGIEDIHFLRFGRTWAEMPPERFFQRFLLAKSQCGGLLVGPDFAFGKDRLGDIHWLEKASQGSGVRFNVISLVSKAGQKISSSRIRNLLFGGEVEDAAYLLGRPYSVQGRVIRGRGLGRKLGVPTANVRVDRHKLLPRGVYKVRTFCRLWKNPRAGVCNVGVRPTVGGRSRVHVEVHIPGFSGNLYGVALKVEFLTKLRSELRFPSLKALKTQILKDIHLAGSRN